ncbi:anibiotic ABC transporter [Serratia sp. MYb239]|uniref:HlyD family efflux transporter periplasmic adaptor subunit n=1 Tax=Serratia sp. MYb239 TaxID=2033438 RepID=UPI000CF74BC9|nr:HlyD family efflux transporter periplasmic adaptor subunit [Serratia sp. MYb239]AVJ19320.1 anibiotic ABC transporter [Serratia sp. MYb239]
MTQSLFRQEALDANNNKVMGTVSLYSPPYRWLVISLASCLVTLIVLFIVFGSYTKKETAIGSLLPSKGIYNITAPVAGTITDMQVEKGSEVIQHSVLMTISSELSTAMGQTRLFVHDQLTLQNERLQSERESEYRMHAETMGGLKKQLGSLESQVELLQKQQAKRRQQLNLASSQMHKLQQMRNQGFASNQQVDEQQNTVLEVGARLQARIMVSSRAIGFINPGQQVMLRYEAYPYQKFGVQRGRVLEVSTAALSPQEVMAITGDSNVHERLYQVVVELDKQSINLYGKDVALRSGIKLEADFLIEKRRIIEWVFEPLYALGHRL